MRVLGGFSEVCEGGYSLRLFVYIFVLGYRGLETRVSFVFVRFFVIDVDWEEEVGRLIFYIINVLYSRGGCVLV